MSSAAMPCSTRSLRAWSASSPSAPLSSSALSASSVVIIACEYSTRERLAIIPKAEKPPGKYGTTTSVMPSSRATATPCIGPAAP